MLYNNVLPVYMCACLYIITSSACLPICLAICCYKGMPVPEYKLPYQAEIGVQPTFEEMQLLVTKNKARPAFPDVWKDTNQVWWRIMVMAGWRIGGGWVKDWWWLGEGLVMGGWRIDDGWVKDWWWVGEGLMMAGWRIGDGLVKAVYQYRGVGQSVRNIRRLGVILNWVSCELSRSVSGSLMTVWQNACCFWRNVLLLLTTDK